MGEEAYEALGLGTSLSGLPSFPMLGLEPALGARRGGAMAVVGEGARPSA